MPNREREEEGRRMNPDSSAGIYVTASVESQCRMIADNRKMKEEEKIKNSNVNALKRAARINLRATYFYTEKTMHFALRCYAQRARHYALQFNNQKTKHISLRLYIYILSCSPDT